MNAAPTATLQHRVAEARELNPLIRLLRLCADDGRAFPGFAAGAHIRVQVSLAAGKSDWRDYALINFGTPRLEYKRLSRHASLDPPLNSQNGDASS